MIRVLTAIVIVGCTIAPIRAQGPGYVEPYPPAGEYSMHEDVRAGGVLPKSYAYHQQAYQPIPSQQPPPNIMPANGAYGYGFPVTTYRWGWFGTEQYYPRVFWFRGYYNDCKRCAYRQGY